MEVSRDFLFDLLHFLSISAIQTLQKSCQVMKIQLTSLTLKHRKVNYFHWQTFSIGKLISYDLHVLLL